MTVTLKGDRPFSVVGGRIRLAVRLTPRANRSGLDGVTFDVDGRPALKLRLVAPPVEGAANKALIAFLAEALNLRKSDISIRSGEASRQKMLQLGGDTEAIKIKLEAWIAQA